MTLTFLVRVETMMENNRLIHVLGDLQMVDAHLKSRLPSYYGSRLKDPIEYLRNLSLHLAYFGIKCNIQFQPLLAYNCHYYEGGPLFQIGIVSKKRFGMSCSKI